MIEGLTLRNCEAFSDGFVEGYNNGIAKDIIDGLSLREAKDKQGATSKGKK